MTRLLGVNIPENKRGEIALTYIFGIGRSLSNKIFKETNVDKNKKILNWTEEEYQKIRILISQKYKIEGLLKSEIRLNIKRLIDINCYRGQRHRIGLPVRGQRTKNNTRTRKGKRKTIANKKKVTK
jgi:small subunit ribosomal protein S13